MRIAICDDEKIHIERQRKLIAQYEKQHMLNFDVNEYDTAAKLLLDYPSRHFDILFLDVSMPDMNGFALAEKIRMLDMRVHIIFVTFMEEAMLQAFTVMASDYLVKPVTRERFEPTMDRIVTMLTRRKTQTYVIKLKGGGQLALPMADIQFIESVKHYIHVNTIDRKYEFMGKLDIEEPLLVHHGFVRTHNSYIVNLAHVFIQFDDHVSLLDGTKIPISRKYQKLVKAAYMGFRREGLS